MGLYKELYIRACENVLDGAVPSTPEEEAAVDTEVFRLTSEAAGGKAPGNPAALRDGGAGARKAGQTAA